MSHEEANEIVRETQRLRRTRRALKLGLPTAAALGAGAALAVAAIPGSDGTITGCYASSTGATLSVPNAPNNEVVEAPGALRVIDPSLPKTIANPLGAGPTPNLAAVCDSKQETQITWNQSGPAGPQGPAGLPAVQSPAGPAGSQGPAGAPGAPLIGGTTFGLNNNAGKTFLKLDGIIGGSTDKTHKQDIQIDSFSFGVQASVSQSSGSGAGAGKASIQSFTITKPLDSSSPNLLQAAGQGKTIKEADLLFCRKAGGEQQNYLEIKFSNVLVSSVLDGQSSGANMPTEQVTFAFQKASETFLGTKGAGPTISFNTGVNLKI
jgi:type VI secretion system secreted protein Hcp